MPLPFLTKHKRQDAGTAVEYRNPDSEPEAGDEGMEACAKDVLDAVNANDFKRLSKALHAAFQVYDAAPHDEYDHESEEKETE